MLKAFSQNLTKAYSSPLALVSLTTNPMFFKSKSKLDKAERIKRYMADPRFRRVARLKLPDFKDPNLTFPVTIPIRYRFFYKGMKHPPRLPEHDFINFKNMSGNEILLNLQNVEYLRPSEFASALLELSKRPSPNDVDWSKHEWITHCAEIATKNLAQYPARVVSTLMLAFHRLKVNEPLLWSTLARESAKTVHKIQGKGLAATFVCFISEPDRCTREYKERLASLLPIRLKNMNPSMVTTCFELAIKENLMSDYLFDANFFVMIWRKNTWFGASNYPRLIDALVGYGYTEDLDFWNKDFIPSISRLLERMSAENAEKIIESLRKAKKIIPKLNIDAAVESLKARIVFANTTLKQVENNKFWNIVKNDIEYYREKERLRLEKEHGGAQTTATA